MIFDANMSYGPVYTPTISPCRTPSDLIEAMDWVGIDRALVTADMIRNGCPSEMNVHVARELADIERLEPLWAILPLDTGELGTADEFVASMKEHRIRALTALPSQHRFLLDRVACGGILDMMVDLGIPLLLPLSESSGGRSGWALVGEVLRETPGLKVIALGSGPWGEDRQFRPLMREYETLYLETSRYELDGGIAELREMFGAERLIYGSGYPESTTGGPLLTAMHADIPREDADLILGGNLESILEEVKL